MVQTQVWICIDRHIKRVHKPGIGLSCVNCEFETKDKSSLKQHIQSAHESVKYSCTLCEYSCAYKGALSVHIRIVHDSIYFKCDQCSMQYSYKSCLKYHLESKHSEPLSCKQ